MDVRIKEEFDVEKNRWGGAWTNIQILYIPPQKVHREKGMLSLDHGGKG